MPENLRIITLYCDDIYKAYAERLINSGKNFNLEIHPTEFKLKDWKDISSSKVELLTKTYQKFGGPILYLDSDCEIVASIDALIPKITKHDLTIRHRYLTDRYNAGVIGLGNDRKTVLPFLEKWLSYSKSNAKNFPTLEQKCLEHVVDSFRPRLKIYDLPFAYNFLPGDPAEYLKEDAIILHHKMSRSSDKVREWRQGFFRSGKPKPKGKK
jgi:hypothetical protein